MMKIILTTAVILKYKRMISLGANVRSFSLSAVEDCP